MGSASSDRLRAAVLVSGGGSNLEALLRAAEQGDIPGVRFVLVVASKPGIGAIARASSHHVDSVVIHPADFENDAAFQDAVLSALQNAGIQLVCLAGYLRKIGPGIIQRYRGRILNIHPALLPKYGGAGMWGHHVHEAVLAAGDKESGCTVHVVDEEFDHGPILAQSKVPVKPGDTADTLAARVLEQEHQLYPRVVRDYAEKILKRENPS